MPENRKYFEHGAVHLLTARTEEGLPFVASSAMNLIIWSVMARARTLFDVRVCHFLFMGNHFHMIAVVDNPEHLCGFIGYVKAETAHAVNRLLGRRRKTIWSEGYDSPRLLTEKAVVRYIRYIYANPARANLTESIEEYPGVSSWQMFVSGARRKKCLHLCRNQLPKLSAPAVSINAQRRIVEELEKKSAATNDFILEPFAWVDSFGECRGKSEEDIKAEIIAKLREDEEAYRQKRRAAGKSVLGSTALRRESMLREHQPKKFGRRMICICEDQELRERYINHFRMLCCRAREAYERWKAGDFSVPFPPGLFAPPLPRLCSSVPLNLH